MIYFSPGPVPIPKFVRTQLSEPAPHHRSSVFLDIFSNTLHLLKTFFATEQTVFILTASGSGAMEAATLNTCAEGESVLVLSNGMYGEQWAAFNERLGLQVTVMHFPNGEAVDVSRVAQALEENQYSAVFVQACETSVGVLNPIAELAALVKQYQETILLVDACSALGAVELPMDKLSIDVLLTSSQKVLMSPPGISFIALSDKAWARTGQRPNLGYFDLPAEQQSYQAVGMSRFTPAVLSVIAVNTVLTRLNSQSCMGSSMCMGPVYRERMLGVSEFNQALGRSLGFETFPEVCSPTISVWLLPQEIDGHELRQKLWEKGIYAMGGMGDYAARLLRIGQMGEITNSDLAVLSETLCQLFNKTPAVPELAFDFWEAA